MAIYDRFPYLTDGVIIVKKMIPQDLTALREITDNPNIYRYVPPFLYRKSPGKLLAAIRNCGGRDFERRKRIIAGIYPAEDPDRLIGLAEIYGYKKRETCATIGYKVNEAYWNRGIATRAITLMRDYLTGDCGLTAVHAYVMPENVNSVKALLACGFRKPAEAVSQENRGEQPAVQTDHFVFTRTKPDANAMINEDGSEA